MLFALFFQLIINQLAQVNILFSSAILIGNFLSAKVLDFELVSSFEYKVKQSVCMYCMYCLYVCFTTILFCVKRSKLHTAMRKYSILSVFKCKYVYFVFYQVSFFQFIDFTFAFRISFVFYISCTYVCSYACIYVFSVENKRYKPKMLLA